MIFADLHSPLHDTRFRDALFAVTSCVAVAVAWSFGPHPLLAVAAGILPLAAVMAVRTPFLVCLAFIVFSFFRIHEVFPQLYSLRIPQLLAMAALGVLAWHVLVTRKIVPVWSRQLAFFTAFFLLVTLGMALASNKGAAWSAWSGNYVKIAVMTFAITWLTRESKDFALAVRCFVLAGIAVGLVALSNKAAGIGLVEGTRVSIGRSIGSVLGDPNDLALVLLFPGSFALALLVTPGTTVLERLLGAIGFGVATIAIIATQSRGGLLGIVAVFGLVMLRRVKSRSLVLVLGGIALPLLFAMAGIAERASGGAAEEGLGESAMGRLYAWEAAANMALAHPFTGVGLNNFYVNYFFYSPHWDGLNHAVHSTWFGVLAETGLLGLLIFVLMVVSMMFSIRRSLRILSTIAPDSLHFDPQVNVMALAIYSGLAGFLVSGTFLTQGFTWPLYILLALTVATAQTVSRLEPIALRESDCNGNAVATSQNA